MRKEIELERDRKIQRQRPQRTQYTSGKIEKDKKQSQKGRRIKLWWLIGCEA